MMSFGRFVICVPKQLQINMIYVEKKLKSLKENSLFKKLNETKYRTTKGGKGETVVDVDVG